MCVLVHGVVMWNVWYVGVECMVSRCGEVDVNWCSVTVSYGAGGLSGHLAM